MTVPFTKMHGLGNDFMVLDYVSNDIQFDLSRIPELSHRQFGIGFDQLLQILPPSTSDVDFDYRIYNADGGEVEHCGNGARCFAKYVHSRGLTSSNPVLVKTINRLLKLQSHENGDVSVDMGQPSFEVSELPLLTQHVQEVGSHQYSCSVTSTTTNESTVVRFTALSMGNPHAVLAVDDVNNTDIEGLGTALGSHSAFAQGVNVGFMEILDAQSIRLRVFERGSGETLACGTGACAAVVAGIANHQLQSPVQVEVLGGRLTISWDGDDKDIVVMTGPGVSVYDGALD